MPSHLLSHRPEGLMIEAAGGMTARRADRTLRSRRIKPNEWVGSFPVLATAAICTGGTRWCGRRRPDAPGRQTRSRRRGSSSAFADGRALQQTATANGTNCEPAGGKAPLSENAPEPAGYEAGLGARSREERYYTGDHEPKAFRSPRLTAGGTHKLRLWVARAPSAQSDLAAGRRRCSAPSPSPLRGRGGRASSGCSLGGRRPCLPRRRDRRGDRR